MWAVLLLAAWLVMLGQAIADALPANAWAGQWQIPASETVGNGPQVVTFTQSGSTVTGSYSWCGGGTWTGTVSPDQATWTGRYQGPPGLPGCAGTGGGTFTVTMSADARSFSGSSVTDYGNGGSFDGTYVGGGTEPREPLQITRPLCTGGPWSGLWQTPRTTFTIVQDGTTYTESRPGGETGRGTISGNTVTGTFNIAGDPGTGTFTQVLAPDGMSYTSTGATTSGAPGSPFTARFVGCDLGTTITSPQTISAGPTTLVAPGVISIGALKRSKCVLVRVASRRPARVLVSIFSGRRSIRLFGQKLVVFTAPGRRQPCIPVPFRAHTFNVRTPLRVALGYTAGARPQRTGRKPRPVIRRIRLVP
jgi:hypothetical protein